MVIIGFIALFCILAYIIFVGACMALGSYAFSGVWKGESTLGAVIFIVAVFGMYKLWDVAPFTVTLTSG